MGTGWKMPIAVIGKPTGDGRQFDPGALTHRDLPLSLRYVPVDSGGHNNAVIVGHIAKVGREKDGLLPAQGEFYDDESWPKDVRDAATAARMFVQNKVIGPSVDLDQAEIEREPEPKAYAVWKKEQAGKLKAAKMAHAGVSGSDCGCGSPGMADEAHYDGPHLKVVKSGRFASATLVHIPAFAELSGHAKLTPIDSSDPNVDGTTSSAMIAGAEVTWDWAKVVWEPDPAVDLNDIKIENDAEMATHLEMARKKKLDPEKVVGNKDDEEFGIWLSDAEVEEYAKKRLPNRDKAGQPETAGDGEQGQGGGGIGGGTYAAPDVTKADVRKKLDDADFVDPKGRRFPIASCADIGDAVSSYGRANPKIPYAEFKTRLTAIAKRKGCEGSLPDNWKAGQKMAALMAAAAPAAPPRAWFDDPKLTGPTPLHIGDDGRVYGHVAAWDTCHVGIGDSCVKPPKSQAEYAYFHVGEVVTAEGDRLAVGNLTYGEGGHAGANLGYRAAVDHYDKTSHLGALVRAGEDQYGIWVAGALVPEADDDAVRIMRATPLSGDWRRIGSNLEMMAALHVTTPGFPIPRVTVAASAGVEVPMSLVAAGVVPVQEAAQEHPAGGLDYAEMGRSIARAMAAENAAMEQEAARKQQWRQLLASAGSDDLAADYHEAMGGLLVALVE